MGIEAEVEDGRVYKEAKKKGQKGEMLRKGKDGNGTGKSGGIGYRD